MYNVIIIAPVRWLIGPIAMVIRKGGATNTNVSVGKTVVKTATSGVMTTTMTTAMGKAVAVVVDMMIKQGC
jgi:hypothetical protein